MKYITYKLLLIVVLFSAVAIVSNAQWQPNSMFSTNKIFVNALCVDGVNINMSLGNGIGDSLFHASNSGQPFMLCPGGGAPVVATDFNSIVKCNGALFACAYSGASQNTYGVFKSTDHGLTWAITNNTNRVHALYSDGTTLYAAEYTQFNAFSSVTKSTDNGNTWTGTGFTMDFTNMLMVNNVIYADGKVSTNGGNSWVTPSGPISTLGVYGYAYLNGAVYAAAHNASPNNGVYKSSDNGVTWTSVLSGVNPYCIAQVGNVLMIGTDGGGIWMSDASGGNWVAANGGLPSNYYMGYTFNFISSGSQFVIAAEHVPSGNNNDSAVYVATLSSLGITPSGVSNVKRLSENVYMYPVPASNYFVINADVLNDNLFVNIMDISGRVVLSSPYKKVGTETYFDIADLRTGVYLVNISNGQESICKKLIVAK